MKADNKKKYLANQEELLRNADYRLIHNTTDQLELLVKRGHKKNLQDDPFRLFLYCCLLPTPLLHQKQIENIFIEHPELQLLQETIKIPYLLIKISTGLYAATLITALLGIVGSFIHINAGVLILPAIFLGTANFFVSAMTLDDYILLQGFNDFVETARKTAVEFLQGGLTKERAKNEIIASLPLVFVQINTLLIAEGMSSEKAEQIIAILQKFLDQGLSQPVAIPELNTPQNIEPSRYYDNEES